MVRIRPPPSQVGEGRSSWYMLSFFPSLIRFIFYFANAHICSYQSCLPSQPSPSQCLQETRQSAASLSMPYKLRRVQQWAPNWTAMSRTGKPTVRTRPPPSQVGEARSSWYMLSFFPSLIRFIFYYANAHSCSYQSCLPSQPSPSQCLQEKRQSAASLSMPYKLRRVQQ